MGKITLTDLVTKSPGEVVAQVQENAAAAVAPQPEIVAPVVAAPAESTADGSAPAAPQGEAESKGRKKLTYDKDLLKGKFAEGTEFKKAEKHTVVIDTEAVKRTDILEVLGVEKSAGRVKFKDETTGEIFSMSFTDLFGQAKTMPFKRGDTIAYDGKEYDVKGLNPASQNVVIVIDGKQKYVKIGKVTLVRSAPAPDPKAAVAAPVVAAPEVKAPEVVPA